jgi:hypothetical protein
VLDDQLHVVLLIVVQAQSFPGVWVFGSRLSVVWFSVGLGMFQLHLNLHQGSVQLIAEPVPEPVGSGSLCSSSGANSSNPV